MYLPLRKSNIIASLIVIPIIVITIFGWFTDNITLIKINKNFPPMQFNTALCLLLLAIVNLIPKKYKFSYTRCLFSIIVIVVAFLTLLEYLFSINLHIDTLFSKTFDNSLYPGRMSPNTAICFMLLATANVFPRIKINILLFKSLYVLTQMIVVIITLIALLGYITDISYYFSWGRITGMALHTSVCLLLLSSTKLSFRGIKHFGQRLGVTVSSVIFVLFFMFWLYSVEYEDTNIRSKIDKNLAFLHASLERRLNLEYSAIDRLYKRLHTNSYSSDKAIYADFQAYENDYPSIYFIYYKTKGKTLFLSSYDIDKNQALKTIEKCNIITQNKQKLVCIQKQNKKFNVVFQPNFSPKVISQFNRNKYSIEIYLENEKIYSNLDATKNYTFKIQQDFHGKKNWKIITFFTTDCYQKLQRYFPSAFFIFGVIISFLTQIFFHLLNINFRKNRILRISEEKLRELSSVDPLTNCLNRTTLMKELNKMQNKQRFTDSNFGILFIDLDDFKYVNDEYGHSVGDIVLKETVARLQQILREEDLIARIGGDEFVVVLKNVQNKQSITEIINRVIKFFGNQIYISENLRLIQSISIGVTLSNYQNIVDAEELLKQADNAMYIAKNNGKNQYSYFDETNNS